MLDGEDNVTAHGLGHKLSIYSASSVAIMSSREYTTGVDGKVDGNKTNDFETECQSIATLLLEIKKHEKEILHTKNIKKCIGCGKDIPLDSTFCSLCGASQNPES